MSGGLQGLKRFALLHQIMSETPGLGLAPYFNSWDDICGVPENEFMQPVKSYYLIYYSFMQPSFRTYYFDDTSVFELHVIDTWNMTVTDVGEVRGRFRVELPSRPFMAVQLVRKGTVE